MGRCSDSPQGLLVLPLILVAMRVAPLFFYAAVWLRTCTVGICLSAHGYSYACVPTVQVQLCVCARMCVCIYVLCAVRLRLCVYLVCVCVCVCTCVCTCVMPLMLNLLSARFTASKTTRVIGLFDLQFIVEHWHVPFTAWQREQ